MKLSRRSRGHVITAAASGIAERTHQLKQDRPDADKWSIR